MGWVMNYGVWRPVLLLLCVSLAWRPADASITQASYAPVALTSVTGLPPQLCRPELDLPARISGLAVSELPESVSGNTGAAASFTFYVSQGEHGRPVAGVTFSFRWIGPSLLPVTVAETGAGHYRAEFTALDPGDYQLEGWLMWENHQQAWGPVLEEPGELKAFFTDLRSEPRIRNQHKTVIFRRLGRTQGEFGREEWLARLRVEGSPLAAAATCQSVHFAPDVSPMVGRWLSPVKGTNSDVVRAASHGRWAFHKWRPALCQVEPRNPKELGQCLRQRNVRLILIGDSHTERLSDALLSTGKTIASRVDFRKSLAVIGARGGSAGNARYQWPRKLSPAIAPLLKSPKKALRFLKGRQPASHLLLQFGHHDLRDSSAGLFVHDIRWMLNATFHRLVEASWRGTFIWKTLPAYSYRRDRYAATEFRTNEKIEWASGQILAFLKELTQAMELPFKVRVLDMLAISLPRFSESVDTHHYLADSNLPLGARSTYHSLSWPKWGNDIGVTELQLLANLLCGGDAEKKT